MVLFPERVWERNLKTGLWYSRAVNAIDSKRRVLLAETLDSLTSAKRREAINRELVALDQLASGAYA